MFLLIKFLIRKWRRRQAGQQSRGCWLPSTASA
jgi:hypothetical protein